MMTKSCRCSSRGSPRPLPQALVPQRFPSRNNHAHPLSPRPQRREHRRGQYGYRSISNCHLGRLSRRGSNRLPTKIIRFRRHVRSLTTPRPTPPHGFLGLYPRPSIPADRRDRHPWKVLPRIMQDAVRRHPSTFTKFQSTPSTSTLDDEKTAFQRISTATWALSVSGQRRQPLRERWQVRPISTLYTRMIQKGPLNAVQLKDHAGPHRSLK